MGFRRHTRQLLSPALDLATLELSMAVTLGKRKRRSDVEESSDAGASDEDVRTLFQRAFEAKFKPLKKDERTVEDTVRPDAAVVEERLVDSEWSGLSDDDGDEGQDIVVVEHNLVQTEDEEAQRREMKAFMV